jgi:hypothetical protein
MNLPLMSAQNNQPLSAGAGFHADTSAANGTLLLTFSAADTYPLEIDGAFVPNFDVAPLGASNSQGLEFVIYNQSAQTSGGGPTGLIYIQSGSSGSGINSVIGRNYWYDNADQTVGVATESSSSPITPQSSGPLINGSVAVYQQPGLFFSSTTRTTVTGGNSTDSPGPVNPQINGSMVGQALYLSASGAATSTFIGIIASVGSSSTLPTAISYMKITSVSAPNLTTLANGTSQYLQTFSYS